MIRKRSVKCILGILTAASIMGGLCGCRQENNWKIYTCEDGTVIIYYPGDPAHLEISDGEYAGLYKAEKDI